MNFSKIRIFVAAAASVFLTLGCGGKLVRNREDDQVNQIKKVAIVSLDVLQPALPLLGDSNLSKESAHVQLVWANLSGALAQHLNWEVTPLEVMTQNPDYQTEYQKTMKGFQNKVMAGRGRALYYAPQVMDSDSARIMGQDGRDQLIKSLAVDAIVVAHVRVESSGFTVGGIGPKHAKAMVDFRVYRLGQQNPVWYDGGVTGEPSEESFSNLSSKDTENTAVVQSAQTAFAKLSKTSTL